jgi:hypothetical protein
MLMRTPFSTTIEHGSSTCLHVSYSQMQLGTARRGCTFFVSATGTQQVSLVGAPLCFLFSTASSVRRVSGPPLRPLLEVACTYSSSGCGFGNLLNVHRCSLLGRGSMVFLLVDGLRMHTFGTR